MSKEKLQLPFDDFPFLCVSLLFLSITITGEVLVCFLTCVSAVCCEDRLRRLGRVKASKHLTHVGI